MRAISPPSPDLLQDELPPDDRPEPSYSHLIPYCSSDEHYELFSEKASDDFLHGLASHRDFTAPKNRFCYLFG
jgi:hypothetical protein